MNYINYINYIPRGKLNLNSLRRRRIKRLTKTKGEGETDGADVHGSAVRPFNGSSFGLRCDRFRKRCEEKSIDFRHLHSDRAKSVLRDSMNVGFVVRLVGCCSFSERCLKNHEFRLY